MVDRCDSQGLDQLAFFVVGCEESVTCLSSLSIKVPWNADHCPVGIDKAACDHGYRTKCGFSSRDQAAVVWRSGRESRGRRASAPLL